MSVRWCMRECSVVYVHVYERKGFIACVFGGVRVGV